MKTKIMSAVIAIILCTLTGCSSTPEQTSIYRSDDSATTENVPNVSDSPEGSPSQEETPSATDAPSRVGTDTETEAPPHAPATPSEGTEKDVLLRCTANSLNVRRGEGTSSAVLGSLDKGDMVKPIGRSGDWYEILYLGASAYISASHVTEVSFEKTGDSIESVITEGKKLLGIPYVYGAQRYHFGNGSLNPAYDGKSYDCSSLMQYIFKAGADIDLAMTSRAQSLQGTEIKRTEIRRGDLLFFTNASRFNKTGLERIGHVALYLGDNIILHTASDHAVIEPISELRNSYFICARRIIDG